MSKQTILSVKNLETHFKTPEGIAKAVDKISFDIYKGKTMALVGESGSGKSVTALSIMRLIQGPAGEVHGGEIHFQGKDLRTISDQEMRKIRGDQISMIFQEPMTSLNPVLTIGEQITEVTRLHKGFSKKEAWEQAIEMLDIVQIPDPKMRILEYPHQLSGGMKQRVMIAMALSCEPDLLIADEPTTALDVTVQAQILKLMKDLQEKKGTAILLITHDLGVVYEVADDVTVMYAGKVMEEAKSDHFFASPQHPYSKRLFDSIPDVSKRGRRLQTIPGRVPNPTNLPIGCRFANRCDKVFDLCQVEQPRNQSPTENHRVACHLFNPATSQNVLEPEQNPATNSVIKESLENRAEPGNSILFSVKNLQIHFPIHRGFFKRIVGHVKAVDGVEFDIYQGETLALVGESGCGKTTAGKGMIRLLNITKGEVTFNGTNLGNLSQGKLRKLRKDFQIMFQDPYSSLNPRMMVSQIISEGIQAQGMGIKGKAREEYIKSLLERVGLDPNTIYRYPHEFSGGQRQRIGIARFLAVQPKFVVCDEVTSALDVSVQAQILNLLKDLQHQEKLSYLFITHNLSVVSYVADRVAVMYLGRIIEIGKTEEIFNSPKHPYTKALLAASPKIGIKNRKKLLLEGDVPSPINLPTGCYFHPRCPEVRPECKEKYPDRRTCSTTHSANCWLIQG